MGMFDIICVCSNCPYCGKASGFELQTKDLNNLLNKFRALEPNQFRVLVEKKHLKNKRLEKLIKLSAKTALRETKVPEPFDKKLKYISFSADCHSAKCQFDADRRDLIMQGSPSGFGRLLEGKLPIKKGYFISKPFDIKLDNYSEKWFLSFKREIKKNKKTFAKYKKLMKKYKDEAVALRMWPL